MPQIYVLTRNYLKGVEDNILTCGFVVLSSFLIAVLVIAWSKVKKKKKQKKKTVGYGNFGRIILARVFLLFVILRLCFNLYFSQRKKKLSGHKHLAITRSTPSIPLSRFRKSLCCPIVLSQISSVERQCSIRGRYRRTSIRSVISKVATAQLGEEYFDFAEFGVENAESVQDFAQALNERTTIWLYDTFTGLPKASSRDSNAALGRQNKFQGSEDNAIRTWKNVGKWNIVTRKGLFDDQLKLRTKPNKVGVLHCDGDLYASIHGVLIRIYPNVLNKGVIIIDDWFGGHTGVWESARKAVYDFIIETEVAPKIMTPLGMSAFWFKTKHDECPGCYISSNTTKWSPSKNPDQILKFKAKYQEMLTTMDSIVKRDCENDNFDNLQSRYTSKLFSVLTRDSSKIVRICASESIDYHKFEASYIPDIVYVGTKCTEYDLLIAKWWRTVRVHGLIVLECWESSISSLRHGCRPDFYRFVQSNGIMPLLTTFFDDDIAFWIKGPLPVG